MISRSRLAMPAGSGLLSLEESQRAVHVFLIQVATLQVSFARARIERCAPVQHSVVVVGDEVSGLKSQLEPILRIAQHAPERGEGLVRSEEHTSELQSRSDLVCRLLLEKKKK